MGAGASLINGVDKVICTLLDDRPQPNKPTANTTSWCVARSWLANYSPANRRPNDRYKYHSSLSKADLSASEIVTWLKDIPCFKGLDEATLQDAASKVSGRESARERERGRASARARDRAVQDPPRTKPASPHIIRCPSKPTRPAMRWCARVLSGHFLGFSCRASLRSQRKDRMAPSCCAGGTRATILEK